MTVIKTLKKQFFLHENFLKELNFLFLLLVSFLVISGCNSNKFDRDAASKLITETFQLPYSESRKFLVAREEMNSTVNWAEKYKIEYLLNEKGYRDIKIVDSYETGGIVNWKYNIVSFSFTEKILPLVLKKNYESDGTVMFIIKVSDLTLGEIVSFREVNENETEVEFSFTRKPNEIGETILNNEGYWYNGKSLIPGLNEKNLKSIRVNFFKYDDGWKISPDDIAKVKRIINPENN